MRVFMCTAGTFGLRMWAISEMPEAQKVGSSSAPGICLRNSGENSPWTVEVWTPTFSNRRPCIIDMTPPPPFSSSRVHSLRSKRPAGAPVSWPNSSSSVSNVCADAVAQRLEPGPGGRLPGLDVLGQPFGQIRPFHALLRPPHAFTEAGPAPELLLPAGCGPATGPGGRTGAASVDAKHERPGRRKLSPEGCRVPRCAGTPCAAAGENPPRRFALPARRRYSRQVNRPVRSS